jgi:diguanylate cyclase (GGDEF)-like protein/PAS domain S-box-containing protein
MEAANRDSAATPDAAARLLEAVSLLIPKQQRLLRSYALAVILTGLALLIRLVIAPLDGGIQYVTFFPAMALSAVVGGLAGGLLSAAIGVTLATWLFWAPFGEVTFAFANSMLLSNTVFLVDAVLVSGSIEAMHRLYRRYMKAEQGLKLAASVFENAIEGVMVTDAAGVILAVNPAFTDITGYTADEAIGQTPRLLRSDHQEPGFYRSMWETLVAKGRWQGELWNRRKDGAAYLVLLTINVIKDQDAQSIRYVGMFHDVTVQRERDAEIRHLAFHDALTGLPNRALIQDRFDHALARASRDGSRLAAVFVDLDGFKGVNDALGHDIGDLLLQEVARRIKARVRAMDTVARIGGDEFVILLEDVVNEEDCAALAVDVIAAISEPMRLRGCIARVGASIGIAMFPRHGSDGAELMKAADSAMYAAKAAGRNTFRLAA